MKLTVNGEAREFAPKTTIAALVPEGRSGIAVALDGEVVPRQAWTETELTDGQKVEIVEAKAGG
ncbi:MAG TPA: sulfur carrier protein ThiS [Gaiellaceae bacterium]|jgi:sulfur carrier protein